MTRYTYPHTIENGAGERLTFARKAGGIAGERLEGENVVQPGAGPPMHVHHLQEEVLTVREGRIGYQRLGQPPQYAGPGETLRFGPGEPHKFWNAGEGNQPAVQRVVFPMIVALGRLLGRYRRYADAPPPVSR
jgi:quercetin dioxygenase-like cupin family protein